LGAVRRRPCAVRAHAARQRHRPRARPASLPPDPVRGWRRAGRRHRPAARRKRGSGRMSAAPADSRLARFAVSPARRRRDRTARALILAATLLALVPLILIVYYLLRKGLGSWSTSFFSTDPTGNTFFA